VRATTTTTTTAAGDIGSRLKNPGKFCVYCFSVCVVVSSEPTILLVSIVFV